MVLGRVVPDLLPLFPLLPQELLDFLLLLILILCSLTIVIDRLIPFVIRFGLLKLTEHDHFGMNLLFFRVDLESNVENEEYHAPAQADKGHKISGRSIIYSFIEGTSSDGGKDLTNREEGAIETRTVVTD